MSFAPPLSDVGGFFDSVDQFFSSLAGISWGALVIGLASFIVYLTLRSRAYFNVIRAAYPTEHIEFRRIWGAYIAAYGFNNVVPARGGDLIRLFLTKSSVPNSSYPAVASSFAVELVFDLSMAVFILIFAFTQGVFPKPPDFSKLGRLRPLLLRLALAVHAVPAHVRSGWRRWWSSPCSRSGSRRSGRACKQGVDDPARPPALLPRGLAGPVRRLAVPLHGLLVPARGVPRRRLGAQRAARARRQRRGGARALHARRRRRPAGAAGQGVRPHGGRGDGRGVLGGPADRDRGDLAGASGSSRS